MADDDSNTAPHKAKRERSTRYPGVTLAESVEMCKTVEGKGLDGLTAGDIALAMGYKNIKTNTFSSALSATRQFGLLVLKDEGYSLTPLAKAILHPVDPNETTRFYRQAFLIPPLYQELAQHFADKRVPDPNILGNVLYHNHQIIATSKQQAAEAFLDSARFAGMLGEDMIFRPSGAPAINPTAPSSVPTPAPPGADPVAAGFQPTSAAGSTRANDIRIDLRLWDSDQGKAIRVRAPEVITPASFERLIQTLRLHLRIEESEPIEPAEDEDEAADDEE